MSTTKTKLGRGPRPAARPAETKRPRGVEIFTDREKEQPIIKARMACTPSKQKTEFLTQFYGIGGIGKSTLREFALKEKTEKMAVIRLDFDHNQATWNPTSSGRQLLREFIKVASESGLPMPLSGFLLSLQEACELEPAKYKKPEDAVNLVIDILDKGAELAKNIPAVGIGIKAVKMAKEWWKKRNLLTELESEELWPFDSSDKDYFSKLEDNISNAVLIDLVHHLEQDKGRHLRIIIDGFEGIQSREKPYETHYDAQRRLQEMLATLSETESVCDRIRVLLFGRHQLEWSRLYDSDDFKWAERWNLHLLEGLPELHSKELILKQANWFEAQGEKPVADLLRHKTEAILNAAGKEHRGEECYIPFWIDLAVDLVADAARKGVDPDLGKGSDKLFSRFTKEIGDLKQTLQVLALAERFDETLFDWLCEKRVINHTVGSFRGALGLSRYCFYEEINEDDYEFHGLFLDAVQKSWLENEDLRHHGASVVKKLLDYYGGPLLAKAEIDWTEEDAEQWRRGMEIIVTQGPELGLLKREQWDEWLKAEPWSVEHFRCLKSRVDFARRTLDRVLDPEHPATLGYVHKLEHLLEERGEYVEVEALYRRVLEVFEKTLSPEHSDTLRSVRKLAYLLEKKGDYAGAEPLYRRVLEVFEKTLIPEHPDTLRSVNHLARLLEKKGDYAGAEALYRRVLEVFEKTLIPEHPATLDYVDKLACLLEKKGDCAGAEALYRRALAGREKALGPEHRATLMIVDELAGLLKSKGDYAGAEPLYRRVLDGWEKFYSPPVSSARDLAELLRKKGDYAGAEALDRRVLEIHEKFLSEHPNTMGAVRRLKEKGDYAGAEALCRRMLEDKEKTLSPEHPDTLEIVDNLAHLLEKKGDYAGAEPLYRRALEGYEKFFGPKSNYTLGIVRSLAVLLWRKGDYAGAEPLHRWALAGFERRGGSGGIWMWMWTNNLAILLRYKGDYAGAEALYRRALAGREKELGPEHRDTLGSVNGLAILLSCSGRLPEAVQLLREKAALSPKALEAVRYNLARYECLSGNLDEAKRLIAEELAANPEKKEKALQDDDLKAIRDFIQTL